MTISVREPSASDWPDVAALFGSRGARGGCWCMWWRLSGANYRRTHGPRARELLAARVLSGLPAGLLAYDDDVPVGWVGVGPRLDFAARLERWTGLDLPDDETVWAIVCFYVRPESRRGGRASAMLAGVINIARSRGVTALEAYPTIPDGEERDHRIYTGTLAMFEKAGFRPYGAHTAAGRPVYRLVLEPHFRPGSAC